MPSNAILKRRSLIKQLGAAAFLATPVFRAVISEAQASFPLRLVLLNVPGGMPWGASNDSLDTRFDHGYAPFVPFQGDSIVFDNVKNTAADVVSAFFELEAHGGGCRAVYGGGVRDQGCGGPAPCGPELVNDEHWPQAYGYGTCTSFDQLMATRIGHRTPFDAVLLGAYPLMVCHFRDGQVIRPMSNPMTAYGRLFGSGVPSATPAPTGTEAPVAPDPALLALAQRGKSRLDFLTAEVNSVKAIAGADEQAKLDRHLTALRELERRLPGFGEALGGLEVKPGEGCAPPSDRTANTAAGDLSELSTALIELSYQTLNCDLSRILTFQVDFVGDPSPRYKFLGINEDHHALEHEGDSANYRKVQLWICGEYAKLMRLMKDTPEGSGSMLDNSIVYVTSDMGNGTHVLSPAHAAIFGKAGGAFRAGRRVDMGGRNVHDIFASIARTMGVELPYVGDPEFNAGPVDLG